MKNFIIILFALFTIGRIKADLINTGFLLSKDDSEELLMIEPVRVEYTSTERSTYSDNFSHEVREFVFWGETVSFAIGTSGVDEPLQVGKEYPSHPLWNLYTPNEDGTNGLWFYDGEVGPQIWYPIQIGSFRVLDLEIDDFGNVESIAVDFTQINEDNTVTSGAMRYNSTVAFDAAVPESGTASLFILAFIVLSRRLRAC